MTALHVKLASPKLKIIFIASFQCTKFKPQIVDTKLRNEKIESYLFCRQYRANSLVQLSEMPRNISKLLRRYRRLSVPLVQLIT